MLFTSLVTLDTVAPAAARATIGVLTPGASLLAKFLPLFFVPSLVVLPLQPAPGLADAAKLAFLTVAGWVASVVISGYTLSVLAKIASSFKAAETSSSVPTKPAFIHVKVPTPVKPPPFSSSLQRALAAATLITGAAAAVLARIGSSAAGAGAGGGIVNAASQALLHCGVSAHGCEAAFALSTTAFAFISGSLFPQNVRKVVHPVLFTAFATVLSLQGFAALAGLADLQGPLTRYLTHAMSASAVGGGDLLLFCLGPAVITFGLDMYARRKVMAAQWFEVCGSAVTMAVVGLFGTAALARGLGMAEKLRLATTMRQITSPLALSCANTLGTDGSIAVALVVVTGLLGANFGGTLMAALGVKSPVARGLTMGATAHGLGTASMATDDPKAFAFSAIAMALVGTATAAFVAMPPVRVALRAAAGVP